MTKLCETCRFWLVEVIAETDHVAGWHECERESRPGALMASGEYAESNFITQKTFGCVQWEKKDD